MTEKTSRIEAISIALQRVFFDFSMLKVFVPRREKTTDTLEEIKYFDLTKS